MMLLRWVLPGFFSFFAAPLFAGPAIKSFAPAGGPVGISITITGSNFGATEGARVVSLNAVNGFVARWSDTEIVAVVPSGASSGPFSVTVSGQTAGSSAFTVTALPAAWAQTDIGSPGIGGSGAYANGTLTVQGAGSQIYGTSDAFHFVYEPLSGDRTIMARGVGMQGNASNGSAGAMTLHTLHTVPP